MASENLITLTAQCLCKAHTFTTQVAASKLPLDAHICHCDSCRHVTGALYSADASWPEPRANVDVSKLKVFHFSAKIDLLFCPTCSTPMFFDSRLESRPLGVLTGVLANIDHDAIKFISHIFVGDTLDGGGSVWLRYPHTDDVEAKRYKVRGEGEDKEELDKEWPESASLTGYEAKKEDTVPVWCKCKGVELRLSRGDYSDKKEEDLPWNIDPKTHKLLAELCGCDSCRLQTGIDILIWTFAEMKYISFATSDKAFPLHAAKLKEMVDAKDPAVGTLACYASSPGVERYFCSTCSATVFYACDDRPKFLDIAVGLLEASDGARAEGLLSWTLGFIGYREDGDGGWRQNLFDKIEKHGEEYRVARGYPKNWKRLAEDKKRRTD